MDRAREARVIGDTALILNEGRLTIAGPKAMAISILLASIDAPASYSPNPPGISMQFGKEQVRAAKELIDALAHLIDACQYNQLRLDITEDNHETERRIFHRGM